MSLDKLADDIQKNPYRVVYLINEYTLRSDDVDESKFLQSIKLNNVTVIPALIKTFSIKHVKNEPKTIEEIANDPRFIDTLFTLISTDLDYIYLGRNVSAEYCCRNTRTKQIEALDGSEKIKWLF